MFGLVTFMVTEDIFSKTQQFLQKRKTPPKHQIPLHTPFTAARQPHYPGDLPGNGKNRELQKNELRKTELFENSFHTFTVVRLPHYSGNSPSNGKTEHETNEPKNTKERKRFNKFSALLASKTCPTFASNIASKTQKTPSFDVSFILRSHAF
jgi:hypothetical protein